MYPRFSETFVVSEILAREAQGERIVIFSLRPTTDTHFHPELARVAAPVVHIPRPTSANRLWSQLRTAAEDPRLARGLAEALPQLLEFGYDDAVQAAAVAEAAAAHGVTHLHAHFASVATSVARLASTISGIPYSFTAHAKDIFHEDTDEEDLRAKFADAHHAVTISGYNLNDLHRRFPESSGKIRLVRNGLELERFPFVAEDTPAPGDAAAAAPLKLLAVGRLVEKKGFSLVIEATARLRAAGLDVTADIAGDGPLAEELAAQITRLGLQDAVRLLGPCTQAEVSELMGSHDLFVAPFVIGGDGNADGLPTVLLEAMARGIICVAADVTAVGEVVRTGETGWLVPTGDLDALVAAVAEAGEQARQNPAARQRMAAAARGLIEELFDSTAQARRLRELTGGTAPAERQDTPGHTPGHTPAVQPVPEGALR
ncbi:glycosyltransferase family 4 protein [Nesterenkonia aerolata]